MAKKGLTGKPAKSKTDEPRPTRARPSSLIDTRVIYCGDNLEQLAKLQDGCIDLAWD